MKLILVSLALAVTICCAASSKGRATDIPLVQGLELDRYLGKWYEIARLDHRFERNLDSVTATYSLRDDGKIKVYNRGFNIKKGEWSDIEGRAWIPDKNNPALLKVSFFWFFAADYRVIALDKENYSYAMVTSKSKKYLWILAREPQLDQQILDSLIEKAREWDFNLEDLYMVKH